MSRIPSLVPLVLTAVMTLAACSGVGVSSVPSASATETAAESSSTTGSSAPSTGGQAAVMTTLNANTASVAELQAAFEAAGISNADKWARSAARALAMTVLVTSAIGVLIHIRANYEAAPLDFRYTDSWPTTSEPVRWLLAATDTVGPSPTLAPAAIAFMALALLLATICQPSRIPPAWGRSPS